MLNSNKQSVLINVLTEHEKGGCDPTVLLTRNMKTMAPHLDGTGLSFTCVLTSIYVPFTLLEIMASGFLTNFTCAFLQHAFIHIKFHIGFLKKWVFGFISTSE